MADKLTQKYIECLTKSSGGYTPPAVYEKKKQKSTKPSPVVKFPYTKRHIGKREEARMRTMEGLGKMRPRFLELITELERAILCHRPDAIVSFSADYLESKLIRRALMEEIHREDEVEEQEEDEDEIRICPSFQLTVQALTSEEMATSTMEPCFDHLNRSVSEQTSTQRTVHISTKHLSSKTRSSSNAKEEEGERTDLKPIESWWNDDLGRPSPLLSKWLGFAESGSESETASKSLRSEILVNRRFHERLKSRDDEIIEALFNYH